MCPVARNPDESYNDHGDTQAEEDANTELLAKLDFDLPENASGDADDYVDY